MGVPFLPTVSMLGPTCSAARREEITCPFTGQLLTPSQPQPDVALFHVHRADAVATPRSTATR